MSNRHLEVGPGFLRAKECPDCFHTNCDEDCGCNCDAARAEDEAGRLRVLVERYERTLRDVVDGKHHAANCSSGTTGYDYGCDCHEGFARAALEGR
jgi:hypothetical protein